MDKILGSLFAKLEQANVTQNTIIIFTSDNGGLDMGYPNKFLRAAKGTMYEGGHRVPFVMRYDGVLPAGEKRTKHYISLADVYASLAEFIGVDIPLQSAQDSISFASYAKSEQNNFDLRKYLPTWLFKKFPTKGHRLVQDSIRYGDFKYSRRFANRDKIFDPPKEALYNLAEDLQEQNNLLEDIDMRAKYKELKQKMKRQLRRLGQCPNDRQASFELSGGPDAGKSVSCDWFLKKTKKRCSFQMVGELYCNSICGRFRDQCSLYE